MSVSVCWGFGSQNEARDNFEIVNLDGLHVCVLVYAACVRMCAYIAFVVEQVFDILRCARDAA